MHLPHPQTTNSPRWSQKRQCFSTFAGVLIKTNVFYDHPPVLAVAFPTGNAVSWPMVIIIWMESHCIRKNLISPESLFSSWTGCKYIKLKGWCYIQEIFSAILSMQKVITLSFHEFMFLDLTYGYCGGSHPFPSLSSSKHSSQKKLPKPVYQINRLNRFLI